MDGTTNQQRSRVGGEVERSGAPLTERRLLPAIKAGLDGPAGRVLAAGVALSAGIAAYRLAGGAGGLPVARVAGKVPSRETGGTRFAWIRVEETLEAGRITRSVEALLRTW